METKHAFQSKFDRNVKVLIKTDGQEWSVEDRVGRETDLEQTVDEGVALSMVSEFETNPNWIRIR